MGAFEYLALDDAGKTRRGVLEGETQRQARQQLRDQGLIPLSVDEFVPRKDRVRRLAFTKRVGSADLALLTSQLTTLIGSGLPLEDSLRTVARQSPNRRIESIVLAVRTRVAEGRSLAESLGMFPEVFPEIYRATVAAGEQAGNLDQVLSRLADHLERGQHVRHTIFAALLYPAVLTTIAVLVVAALLGYVVPEVMRVFESTGQELPWLTRALIGLSEFVRAQGLTLVVFVAAAAIGVRYLLRTEDARYVVDRTLLRIPLVASLVRGRNASRFAHTLSTLLASAVPMLEALRISSSVVVNLAMRRRLIEAAREVSEGGTLHAALGKGDLFPPVTVQLVATGEASGSLAALLDRAAQDQDKETQRLLMTIVGLFEPLLILLMGGIVLSIVIAILLPIFELNHLVR